MFGGSDHDVKIVRQTLGAGVDGFSVGGFFAAGEIGPVGGRNHVHAFTASILAFGSLADSLTESLRDSLDRSLDELLDGTLDDPPGDREDDAS
jgi:hypothetical protein